MKSASPPLSRRAFVAGAACIGALPAPSALAQGDVRPLPDMLAYMVETLGPPRQSRRMSARDVARYEGRVPPRLTRFWQEVGLGSYFDGLYWICGAMTLFLKQQEFFWPSEKSRTDSRTGARYPDDYLIGTAVGIVSSQYTASEHELLREARSLQGPLEPGEVYGFFPALQLGGAYAAKSARRVGAAEHFMMLAELGPIYTTSLSPPEPPSHPYGRVTRGRKLGPGS